MSVEIIIYAAICFAVVATVNYIVGYKVGKYAGIIGERKKQMQRWAKRVGEKQVEQDQR